MKKKLCLTRWWSGNDHLRKILMAMKVYLFILFLFVNGLKAESGYSQSTRLNLNLKDAAVKEALIQIEEKSEFFFLYNSKLVDVNRKITLHIKNERIDEILKSIFQETDVVYKVIDKQIILTNKANLESLDIIGVNSTKQNLVSGTVKSTTDDLPIPGVNVQVKGTNTGTITDLEGKFSIQADNNATLIFTFMGYLTQEVPVNSQSVLEIKMEEETKGLEEVVIIGYGTVKKSDLTGSVSSIKSEQLTTYPSSGALQAMQGRAAGVQIQANNGDPGGSVS